jgi:antitoxin MazE
MVTTQLTRIGNSLGVRIPRSILRLAGLEGPRLELKLVDGGLLLAPGRCPRQGWKEAFQQMHEAGEDRLLARTAGTKFDEAEWEW